MPAAPLSRFSSKGDDLMPGDRIFLIALLAGVLVPQASPLRAQGNESTSAASQSESQQAVGEVQIGAGSTAAVTTGSSGKSSSKNPSVAPLPRRFEITPPRAGLDMPGMLAIQAPARLRCNVIEDRNARTRCGAQAK